jgi:pyruvate kinase
MSGFNNSKKTSRSDEDLARMIAKVANVAQADAIICATETGVFAKLLHSMSGQIRVIAATTKRDTYDVLTQAGRNQYFCLFARSTSTAKFATLFLWRLNPQRFQWETLSSVH